MSRYLQLLIFPGSSPPHTDLLDLRIEMMHPRWLYKCLVIGPSSSDSLRLKSASRMPESSSLSAEEGRLQNSASVGLFGCCPFATLRQERTDGIAVWHHWHEPSTCASILAFVHAASVNSGWFVRSRPLDKVHQDHDRWKSTCMKPDTYQSLLDSPRVIGLPIGLPSLVPFDAAAKEAGNWEGILR